MRRPLSLQELSLAVYIMVSKFPALPYFHSASLIPKIVARILLLNHRLLDGQAAGKPLSASRSQETMAIVAWPIDASHAVCTGLEPLSRPHGVVPRQFLPERHRRARCTAVDTKRHGHPSFMTRVRVHGGCLGCVAGMQSSHSRIVPSLYRSVQLSPTPDRVASLLHVFTAQQGLPVDDFAYTTQQKRTSSEQARRTPAVGRPPGHKSRV